MDDSAWGMGTITAAHIEPPTTCFFVTFWDAGIANNLHLPAGERTVRVFAHTAQGALAVAQFHFGGRGRDFRLVEPSEGAPP
jgi:hypothetical protein